MKSFPRQLIALLAVATSSHGAISIAGSSSEWSPFTGNYDFLGDQQTGQPSSDIVGDNTPGNGNYGFFIQFDDNGASLSTDGNLAFRIRFDNAGDGQDPANFKGVVWVGIDADLSGTIDVFLGLNDSGNTTDLIIVDAGSGLNNSPNTTSISNTNYWSTSATSSNYSYRPVNVLGDLASTDDLTPNDPKDKADPDYYLSFVVPFQEVVNFLATAAGGSMTITDQTSMRYVAATATQGNSLNQDLGGVNGGVNSTTTWEDLGGFTPGGPLVPEPSSGLLALGSLTAALFIRRRR